MAPTCCVGGGCVVMGAGCCPPRESISMPAPRLEGPGGVMSLSSMADVALSTAPRSGLGPSLGGVHDGGVAPRASRCMRFWAALACRGQISEI